MNPFSNNRNAMMHQQSYSAEPYREGMDYTDEAWAYGLRALPGSLANQLQALGEYTTGKDYPNKLGNYLDELTQVNEMGYTPQTEYEAGVAFLPELVYDPAIIAGAPYTAYKAARNAPRLLNVIADEAGRTTMRNQIGAAGVKSQLGAVDLPSGGLDQIQNSIKQKHGLKTLFLSESGDRLNIDMIEVPKDKRKSGIGTAAMQDIVDYADSQGKRVYLNPGQADDLHGTTSRNRLVKFYKRFGFVENKGRNKDFTMMGGMYRDPAK